MGISLKDFASFAEGAIERDRELTKEDFERMDQFHLNNLIDNAHGGHAINISDFLNQMTEDQNLILKYENGVPEFTNSRQDIGVNTDAIANLNKAINTFAQKYGQVDDRSEASTQPTGT